MRLQSSVAALCLAIFSDSTLGFGLPRSHITHDLKLSSELGVDSDLIFKDRKAFRSLISRSSGADVSPIQAEYATIPIDHDDPSVGTYKNRYWVNEEYFVPGGPIIIYDGGESNAQAAGEAHLTSDLSFFRKMLADFQAIGIVWEHRYYGESLPFPVSNNTPPEHFKYLTTKQALADIPYFAKDFSRQNQSDVNLTPQGTPWVMIGGSYAGVRSALTRNEYPETIYAAFSSSAPVQARVDMSMYFDQVYRGMVANGLGNCTKDIHAALGYIDDELSKPGKSDAIKQRFLGPGAEKNTNEDFTAALVAMYNYFQSRGTGDHIGNLEAFCDYLEVDPKTNETAGPDGIAPFYGSKHVAERWSTWPLFTDLVNVNMGTNCRGRDETIPASCEISSLSTDPSAISWTWQYCTEWGYFQSNNIGRHSLLSRYQTLEYQQDICNRQFPDAVKNGMLPLHPQAEKVNEEFGGWDIRPTNVYFSSGEFDPWRTLSILSNEEIAPKEITWSSEIPRCEEARDNMIFGHILENAEHAFDFQALSDVGKESRELFKSALREWLKCF